MESLTPETLLKQLNSNDPVIVASGLNQLMKKTPNEEFKKVNFVITYTIAGAFTEYLLLSFGIDTYKEFYSNLNDDIEGSFQKAFKNSLEDMENNFLN